MQARWGVAMLLAAALATVGPGTAALHAGEAPSDRGRPSESESPGSRAPDTPPGQEPQDEEGQADEPDQGGGQPGDDPAGGGSAQDPGSSGPSTTSGGTGEASPPEPPQPDLTGTRVLRSRLGTPRPGPDGDGSGSLRDLHVAVSETDAAGIDGGWWVMVTAPDGGITVTPPTLRTTGEGGVPRARPDPSDNGGLLFSVAGQRSAQRYQGLYEASGIVELSHDEEPERPVITVLLVQ